MRLMGVLCLLPGMVMASAVSRADLPAFPGAEGFGAVAIGGRGGKVIKVTNLHSSGPGSFAAAAAAPGPRMVIFDVGGVIRGDVAIVHPRITIAGQTAPYPGVTLEGRLLARPQADERLHDIVVRFLRIRPPRSEGHGGDAVQLPKSERVMLDHLSLAWANDEVVDIIHSSEVTLQWSTLESSDTQGHDKGTRHNFGLISAYPGSGNISLHHNLFAHHSRRSPSLSPQEPGKPGDVRNNVIYNFRDGLTHDGHKPRAPINLVANYYKRGPSSWGIDPFGFIDSGRYYVVGNVVEGVGAYGDDASRGRLPRWLSGNRRGHRLAEPTPAAQVTTHSAEEAYRLVLQRAGAWPRDRVTRQVVAEVRAGKGKWGRQGPDRPDDAWFLFDLPRAAATVDGDGDGMPDAWEEMRGLDKTHSRDHRTVMDSGYTAIEQYVHERALQRLRESEVERDSAPVVSVSTRNS